MKPNLNFCLITPSHAPDFERCQLLVRSVEEFVYPSVTHYIIVDQDDLKLFRQLQGSNTEIITKESIFPWRIKRLPLGKNKYAWLSLKSFPMRGWLFQQIGKIAISQHINEDVLVFVDSDLAFIRPLNLQSFIREDKVRFFRKPTNNTPKKFQKKFFNSHKSACRLLGLPSTNYLGANYEGNINTWKRENCLKLYDHLERISERGWLETLCSSWHFAEYVLYGAFIDYILQDQSGHYYDDQFICHAYWTPSSISISEEELQKFFAAINPNHVAIMISAKSGISVQRYEKLLKLIPKN